MKNKYLFLIAVFGLAGSTSCFGFESGNPDNEIEFEMDKVTEIIISYDMENIDFYRSESKKLVIREFMSSNKKRYYANISHQVNTIKISEGARPIFDDAFTCRVEVYLPEMKELALTVTTTGGKISMGNLNWEGKKFYADSTFGVIETGAISAESIKLGSTSGKIQCNQLSGRDISLETKNGELSFERIYAKSVYLNNTSGTVKCGELTGQVTYLSTNGALMVENADGSGSYKVGSSGLLNVRYGNITGNIDMSGKNNDINLGIPSGFSFRYKLKSKNGSISVDFLDGHGNYGNEVRGCLGDSPQYDIKIETTNGNINMHEVSKPEL